MRSDRRLVLVSILAFSLAAAALGAGSSGEQRAQQAGRALIGTPAPRLVLKTIDGETIDLKRLYGRQAVYLKFWATWCVPCRQQMPHFEHTYETAGPDLAVIAINAGFNDSLEEVSIEPRTACACRCRSTNPARCFAPSASPRFRLR